MKTSRLRIQQLCWALFITASFVMQLFGGQVIVSWDQNQESDVQGYRLHYGNSSRQYPHQIDVGNVTSYILDNLAGGKVFYFSVTAYNNAGLESDYSEEVSLFIEPDDTIAPSLVRVTVVDEHTLILKYSESVDPVSAENAANYQINNDIVVNSVQLLPDSVAVEINTSLHLPGTYTLTVNNVTDCAHPANVIDSDAQISYQILETVAPDIENVTIIDKTNIHVKFTKELDPVSSIVLNNYVISGGVSVVSATMDEDRRTVFLVTSEHSEGNYVIYVNNIFDVATPPNPIVENAQFQYEYVDKVRPTIVGVTIINRYRLELIFSEPVEKVSAENAANYQINNDVVVLSAELGDDLKTVILSTTEHAENNYQLTVNNVQDQANNPNSILPNSQFDYQYIDTTPPRIANVILVAEDLVEIEFSEPVDVQSAEQITNYRIEPEIRIIAARLDSSYKIVTLHTADHPENQYTLFINNVTDRARQPNVIAANSRAQYQYVDRIAPQIVRALAVAEDTVEVVFSEPVDTVSAQNITNYKILPEIIVHQAFLAIDQTTVYLATSAHLELVYNLSVNNVLDRANTPNAIAPNSSIQYQFVDVTPPSVVSVTAVNAENVVVAFSEKISRQSAENVNNYSISDGVTIHQATLSQSEDVVSLKTAVHQEGEYSMTINGTIDQAKTPNMILENSRFDYSYYDTMPPQPVRAVAVSDTVIEIVFNEPVARSSAENVVNYSINRGIVIHRAMLQMNEAVVHLLTSPHGEGIYSIEIKDIWDRAQTPNKMAKPKALEYSFTDQTPPKIVSVSAVAQDQVRICFDEPINKQSAENVDHYQISDGIEVIAAQLASDTVTVNLTTSIHSEGRYTITVTNIADLAADPNFLTDAAIYEYSYIDQNRPTIEQVTALDPNQVSVIFSEKVEQTSAVNIANYQINNSITIDNITLDGDEKTVHLTTSTHQPGSYIIVINNVLDRANNPNTIMANSYATYQYWDMLPPNVVDVRVLDATHVDVTFNERLEKQSAENLANYKITVSNQNSNSKRFIAHLNASASKPRDVLRSDNLDEGPQTIKILSITLDSNERVVHLLTEAHAAGKHTLTVSNIQDKAKNPNRLVEELQVDYHFADTTPPEVTHIKPLDDTHIEVCFSKPLESASASNGSNYQISRGVEVVAAHQMSEPSVVRLETTPHREGASYVLILNNIRDRAKNTIRADSRVEYIFTNPNPTAPMPIDLVSAVNDGNGGVLLNWRNNSQQTIIGYKVYYGRESKRYDTNVEVGNVVTAQIGDLVEGVPYYFAVTARNQYQLESDFSNEISLVIEVIDLYPPKVIAVNAVSDTEIVVLFDEKVLKSSAEKIDNYRIQPLVAVKGATLQANELMVKLVTEEHLPGEYMLEVSNLMDQAPNPNVMPAPTQHDYFYFPNDQVPPYLSDYKVVSKNRIDLIFSEYLDKTSAENTSNYRIDRGVAVHRASLDPGMRKVSLSTDEHQDGYLYTLTINNILDCAVPPNRIAADTKIRYRFSLVDTKPPEIYDVKVLTQTEILINFSEQIQRAQAEMVGNYFINNNVSVIRAELLENQKSVRVMTSPHQADLKYMVSAKNIRDYAVPPNIIEQPSNYRYSYQPDDCDSPILISAQAIDAQQLAVRFSEYIDRTTAENAGNYTIDKNVQVVDVKISVEPHTVFLLTTPHVSGERYTLSVQNVTDNAVPANLIDVGARINYVFVDSDREPPRVESCHLKSEVELLVNFNKVIDRQSAENVSHYAIDNGIEVESASLDSTLKSVLLTTSPHRSGISYRLKVKSIRDRAMIPNVMIDEAEIFYSLSAPNHDVIANLQPSHYRSAFLGVGDALYSDTDELIATIPVEFQNCLWIKTAQRDFQTTGDTLISFLLRQRAKVFIGFDANANNYPNWLVDNFYRTGASIGIRNATGNLDLWEAEFDSGKVALGGNAAAGAEDVQRMYTVLIRSQAMQQLATPDGMEDPESQKVVTSYLLRQNYPNPFNDNTTLRYETPEDCQVEINIYNILGQLVRQLTAGMARRGVHAVQWDGRNKNGLTAPSGVYFARMVVRESQNSPDNSSGKILYTQTKKMVVVR
ncbi:MAG TPA: T9SS type A sorting domain-containing protein [bacterium]|nr:T9SS type A sorting domain-containing protein [bacterium]